MLHWGRHTPGDLREMFVSTRVSDVLFTLRRPVVTKRCGGIVLLTARGTSKPKLRSPLVGNMKQKHKDGATLMISQFEKRDVFAAS